MVNTSWWKCIWKEWNISTGCCNQQILKTLSDEENELEIIGYAKNSYKRHYTFVSIFLVVNNFMVYFKMFTRIFHMQPLK
jgi:hypothetical protein